MPVMRRKWLVMDWRAAFDIDQADTFEVCDSEPEAKLTAPTYGDDTVIVMVEEADLSVPPPRPSQPKRKRA